MSKRRPNFQLSVQSPIGCRTSNYPSSLPSPFSLPLSPCQCIAGSPHLPFRKNDSISVSKMIISDNPRISASKRKRLPSPFLRFPCLIESLSNNNNHSVRPFCILKTFLHYRRHPPALSITICNFTEPITAGIFHPHKASPALPHSQIGRAHV